MKKLLLTVALLALAFSNAYAEEGDDSEQERDGLRAFASFDKDRDGFVTQEELNAHAKTESG